MDHPIDAKTKSALAVPCLIDKRRNGAAAIVRFEGRVLVSKRIACRDMNGTWQFPGGAIESGESAYEAVVREIIEETGIDFRKDLKFSVDSCEIGIGLTTEGYPHVTTFYVFDCRVEPMPINKEPDRHSDWEWVTPEELLKRPTMGLIKTVLQSLQLGEIL